MDVVVQLAFSSACFLLSFSQSRSLSHGMLLPPLNVGLPTLNDLLRLRPHRHDHAFSRVILDPVSVTFNVSVTLFLSERDLASWADFSRSLLLVHITHNPFSVMSSRVPRLISLLWTQSHSHLQPLLLSVLTASLNGPSWPNSFLYHGV